MRIFCSTRSKQSAVSASPWRWQGGRACHRRFLWPAEVRATAVAHTFSDVVGRPRVVGAVHTMRSAPWASQRSALPAPCYVSVCAVVSTAESVTAHTDQVHTACRTSTVTGIVGSGCRHWSSARAVTLAASTSWNADHLWHGCAWHCMHLGTGIHIQKCTSARPKSIHTTLFSRGQSRTY